MYGFLYVFESIYNVELKLSSVLCLYAVQVNPCEGFTASKTAYNFTLYKLTFNIVLPLIIWRFYYKYVEFRYLKLSVECLLRVTSKVKVRTMVKIMLNLQTS